MSSSFVDLAALALKMENTLHTLMLLGFEYQNKAITPERFAERAHQILAAYANDQRNAALSEQGKAPK